jgi:hypothetical protein
MGIRRTTLLVCLLACLGSVPQATAAILPPGDRAPRSLPPRAAVGAWLWCYLQGGPTVRDAVQYSASPGESDGAFVLVDDLAPRDFSSERPSSLPFSPEAPPGRENNAFPAREQSSPGNPPSGDNGSTQRLLAIACKISSCDPSNMPGAFPWEEVSRRPARQRSRLFRPPRW